MDWTWIDVLLRVITVLGLPTIGLWFLRERRRQHATDRQAEADADVTEAEVPMRVRSTSVITLESELAALSKTFQDDRALKESTIAWLKEQLEEERAASAAKDQRIHDLEGKVKSLQERVAEVSEELARVSDDLRSLQTDDPKRDTDPRRP